MSSDRRRMIDRWFPCAEVDKAVGTPEGSGRSEKAIFTWFASRPIAQARAAVLTALLPDDEKLRSLVRAAVLGSSPGALPQLAEAIRQRYPEPRPVVLDVFSGRAIIPLEAARLGLRTVGIDYSPVATLAGRLLADYPLRDWSGEPPLPFGGPSKDDNPLNSEPRLLADVRVLLAKIGDRLARSLEPNYPRNPDGSFPWGHLWAITIPCDACERRFPLLGSLMLRYPYKRTDDPGQSFRIYTEGDAWKVEVIDGLPNQIPTLATAGRRGKSARCPFCQHTHSLDTIKAKGWAGQYADEPILAADSEGEAKKVFRVLRADELAAIRSSPTRLDPIGQLSAIPDEEIPAGNEDTVRASGYGYRTYGELMNAHQTLQFVETVRIVRQCHSELRSAGLSSEYSEALTAYATATLARRLRRSTRGVKLFLHGNRDGSAQNRVQLDNIFVEESKVSFQFDYFESGPGTGPGTWGSIADTGIKALAKHMRGLKGRAVKLRQGSATALPFRDGTVDAVVTDPPYYNMIDHCDTSDLFYVWLKRIFRDIDSELFDVGGLQDKSEEIIVKRGRARAGEHRTRGFYQESLAKAFLEARRVLRSDGVLVVVFGNSDPDAWRRLLEALQEAGFVVTSTWPSRSESANTGVASIKVTVSIGCQVAGPNRPVGTAAQVDREVIDAVEERVRQWQKDGLALTDQLMAAYGPAMEVYGRYSKILQPDSSAAPIERYLTLARSAVRDAIAMKIDSIPLETFDAITRFAVFWMRLYGRTNVPKGEAVFLAQTDGLRIADVRETLLLETKGGYKLTLDPPARISPSSAVFDVVRAMAAAWISGGSDEVARVLARSGRPADDEQIWAVADELTRLLPASDRDAKALAAIQRSSETIRKLAPTFAVESEYGAPGQQLTFVGL